MIQWLKTNGYIWKCGSEHKNWFQRGDQKGTLPIENKSTFSGIAKKICASDRPLSSSAVHFDANNRSVWLTLNLMFLQREHPPRSCTKIFMIRIKTEVPLFLIVFDLLLQMQEKSRLMKRNPWLILFEDYQKSGDTHFFAYQTLFQVQIRTYLCSIRLWQNYVTICTTFLMALWNVGVNPLWTLFSE